MYKVLKSLATVALMGLPAWVIVAGVLRSGPSTIIVRLDEPGVKVRIDGQTHEPVGEALTLGPIAVEPGEHDIRVVGAEGVELFEQRVSVVPGEQTEVLATWALGTSRPNEGIVGLDAEPHDQVGHGGGVTAVATAQNGRAVVSASVDGTMRIWDAATGRTLRRIEAHVGVVQGLALLGDGRHVVSIGDDQLFRIWDLETGETVREFDSAANANVNGLAAAGNGRFCAIGTAAGAVLVYDLREGRKLHSLDLGRLTPGGLAFSPDGGKLLVGTIPVGRDATPVRLYDVASGTLLRDLDGHRAAVHGVAFLPDGRHALTGGRDRTLRLWDVASGKEIRRFEGHSGAIHTVAVSSDGRRAITGTGHQWSGNWTPAVSYGAYLWDLEQGRALGRLETNSPVRSVAFSSDGQRVVAGGEDRVVHWWAVPEPVATAAKSLPEKPADPSGMGDLTVEGAS